MSDSEAGCIYTPKYFIHFLFRRYDETFIRIIFFEKVESDKIFTQIANESFVNWQNAIVRDLAKAQVNAGN
jgi:hypothetical protein